MPNARCQPVKISAATRGSAPRGRVLKNHPKAYAFHWADGWVIYDGTLRNDWLSDSAHKSQAAAWRDADTRNQKKAMTKERGDLKVLYDNFHAAYQLLRNAWLKTGGGMEAAIEMETEQSVSPESRMRPQPASAGVVTADTTSNLRSLLERARDSIKDAAEFAGDDHSVGVCNCQDMRLAEELDAVAKSQPVETPAPRPQEQSDRLRQIANLITSRPVLGHWPAMMAETDANFLRSIASEEAIATPGATITGEDSALPSESSRPRELLASKQRCAVIDCENTTGNGRFVGDFCAPCETALRIGNFDHGTSIPFKLSAEVVRQRIEIERLRTALKDARTALAAVACHSRQSLMAADARAAMVKIGHALGGISDETPAVHQAQYGHFWTVEELQDGHWSRSAVGHAWALEKDARGQCEELRRQWGGRVFRVTEYGAPMKANEGRS